MKKSLRKTVRRFAVTIPAVATLLVALMITSDVASQAGRPDPIVLLGNDAAAFAAALSPGGAVDAAVAVVVAIGGGAVEVVLIDPPSGRKHWAVLSVSQLLRVLSGLQEHAAMTAGRSIVVSATLYNQK